MNMIALTPISDAVSMQPLLFLPSFPLEQTHDSRIPRSLLSKRFSWQQRTWPECVGVAEWYPGVCNLELANRLIRSSERERRFSFHFAGAQFVSTDFIFFVLRGSASALSPSRIFNKHPQQRLKTGCKITFCNKTSHPTTQGKD